MEQRLAQMSFGEAGAFQMTPEQDAVWRILSAHRGKGSAIRIRDLVKLCRLPDRKVRELVTSLVLLFHIRIGSSYSGRTAGYYVIETAEEAEETYRLLFAHALSILHRAAIIRRLSFPDLVGQLLMEKRI